jgi:hypothetical protein
MNGLLIIALILWILTWLVQGFHIGTIFSLIATGLFCMRKVGYFCKFKNVVAIEIVGMLLAAAFHLLLRQFYLGEFLIVLLIRLCFLGVVLYDTKMYVYVTEEKRKQ